MGARSELSAPNWHCVKEFAKAFSVLAVLSASPLSAASSACLNAFVGLKVDSPPVFSKEAVRDAIELPSDIRSLAVEAWALRHDPNALRALGFGVNTTGRGWYPLPQAQMPEGGRFQLVRLKRPSLLFDTDRLRRNDFDQAESVLRTFGGILGRFGYALAYVDQKQIVIAIPSREELIRRQRSISHFLQIPGEYSVLMFESNGFFGSTTKVRRLDAFSEGVSLVASRSIGLFTGTWDEHDLLNHQLEHLLFFGGGLVEAREFIEFMRTIPDSILPKGNEKENHEAQSSPSAGPSFREKRSAFFAWINRAVIEDAVSEVVENMIDDFLEDELVQDRGLLRGPIDFKQIEDHFAGMVAPFGPDEVMRKLEWSLGSKLPEQTVRAIHEFWDRKDRNAAIRARFRRLLQLN